MYVCGGTVGYAILDGKVREGLSERATFQQLQGIWFPAHSRLEPTHYMRIEMLFESRQTDRSKECLLTMREGHRNYKSVGPSTQQTLHEVHIPSHFISF